LGTVVDVLDDEADDDCYHVFLPECLKAHKILKRFNRDCIFDAISIAFVRFPGFWLRANHEDGGTWQEHMTI
jgi:hypothetical protein